MKDPFERDEARRLLTDEQTAYLDAWLRRQADALGLREWDVRASPYPAREGVAQSFITDEADRMVTALSPEMVSDDTPDEQRESLAHELLHPYFQRVTRVAERLIVGELGKRTEAVIEEGLSIFEEQSIDRLARAVAKWLEPFALPAAESASSPAPAPAGAFTHGEGAT